MTKKEKRDTKNARHRANELRRFWKRVARNTLSSR